MVKNFILLLVKMTEQQLATAQIILFVFGHLVGMIILLVVTRAFIKWFFSPFIQKKSTEIQIHHIQIIKEITKPLKTPTNAN